jgi:hypothetical protein
MILRIIFFLFATSIVFAQKKMNGIVLDVNSIKPIAFAKINYNQKIIYSDFNIELLNNRKVTGITSGATALIEKATERIITDQLNLGFPFELFINDKTLLGSFEQGEVVEIDIVADDGSLITLETDTFSFVNRILVIGGSNSQNHHINSYTPTLEKRIRNLTANDVIHKSSYIIPEGVSSAGPTLFFNKKFDFEKSLSLEDWPNIIILEFSITSNHDNNDAFKLDNLIHIIRQKWEINKLLPPSFLIIDLFSTSFFYDEGSILWSYLEKIRSGVLGPPDLPIFNTSFNVMK